MIQPKAFTEQILFHTIRIECDGSTGTGFLFAFQTDDRIPIPVIVTNKHVVDYKKHNKVKFSLHQKDSSGHILTEAVICEWESDWIHHPIGEIDLCCTLYEPINRAAKDKGIELFVTTCTDDMISTNEELNDMQTVNDVLMVGYPDGLFDKKHNLPIIRKGITATHPAIDYEGKSLGIIDMGCYYGSSGSPIYTYPGSAQYSKSKGLQIGVSISKFLGIFFAFICADDDGEIIARIPDKKSKKSNCRTPEDELRSTTEVSLNLGFYIKAKELQILKDEVFKTYNISR